MNYKAVIFDLDGVICYTDKYHYLAWKSVMDELGIPFDEKVNDSLRGISRMDSLEIILKNAGVSYPQEEKEAIAAKKNHRYREYLKTMTPEDLPVEVGITLNRLRALGYKLAVGSSSRNAKTILERLGLGDFFDAVVDGTMISRSKPDPEVFLKAAELLGEEPGVCIVFEDAASGIEAATAGGFDSAGIGEAARSPKCTYPMNSVADLLRP